MNVSGAGDAEKLYVAGIPSTWGEKEVLATFKKFGAVKNVYFMKPPKGGSFVNNVKSAFVTFEKPEYAEKAKELDGFKTDGSKLQVRSAVRKSTPTTRPDPKNFFGPEDTKMMEADRLRRQYRPPPTSPLSRPPSLDSPSTRPPNGFSVAPSQEQIRSPRTTPPKTPPKRHLLTINTNLSAPVRKRVSFAENLSETREFEIDLSAGALKKTPSASFEGYKRKNEFDDSEHVHKRLRYQMPTRIMDIEPSPLPLSQPEHVEQSKRYSMPQVQETIPTVRTDFFPIVDPPKQPPRQKEYLSQTCKDMSWNLRIKYKTSVCE
jgi:hypothetical protein